jgi:hypothetical protein
MPKDLNSEAPGATKNLIIQKLNFPISEASPKPKVAFPYKRSSKTFLLQEKLKQNDFN